MTQQEAIAIVRPPLDADRKLSLFILDDGTVKTYASMVLRIAGMQVPAETSREPLDNRNAQR